MQHYFLWLMRKSVFSWCLTEFFFENLLSGLLNDWEIFILLLLKELFIKPKRFYSFYNYILHFHSCLGLLWWPIKCHGNQLENWNSENFTWRCFVQTHQNSLMGNFFSQIAALAFCIQLVHKCLLKMYGEPIPY